MRTEFVEALVESAVADEMIVLLTGDLGFNALEPFADRFPGRFFNVGVAEQNMIGIATGLAEAGLIPYAYSIATFASMRPYEFIRNGPVLHELPVRVVGMGGGLDYGHNGVTHFAVEDIGLMRAQPDLTVLAPADADQARRAVEACADIDRPVYLRLERHSKGVPGLEGRFTLGRAQLVGDGASSRSSQSAASPTRPSRPPAGWRMTGSTPPSRSCRASTPRPTTIWPSCSRACRSSSRSRRTTSTAASAHSSRRSSPAGVSTAGSCAAGSGACRGRAAAVAPPTFPLRADGSAARGDGNPRPCSGCRLRA